VPDILPRRRILLASATALPILLATAGCRSSDMFSGPDPLAGRPRPAPDVVTLQAAIAAEENLISLYRAALDAGPAAARPAAAAGSAAAARPAAGRSPALNPLLTQHEQHLAQLRARLIQPPGTATVPASAQAPASASASAQGSASAQAPGSASARGAAPGHVTIARLRAAERASAAALVRRLATVEPALAQLFASIAASDATHVTALGG
jgi:hypothetical protein